MAVLFGQEHAAVELVLDKMRQIVFFEHVRTYPCFELELNRKFAEEGFFHYVQLRFTIRDEHAPEYSCVEVEQKAAASCVQAIDIAPNLVLVALGLWQAEKFPGEDLFFGELVG